MQVERFEPEVGVEGLGLQALRRVGTDGRDDLHAPFGPPRKAFFEPGTAERLVDLGRQLDGAADGLVLLGAIDLADRQHGLGDFPRALEVDGLLFKVEERQVVPGQQVQCLAIVVGLGLLGLGQKLASLNRAVGCEENLGRLSPGQGGFLGWKPKRGAQPGHEIFDHVAAIEPQTKDSAQTA